MIRTRSDRERSNWRSVGGRMEAVPHQKGEQRTATSTAERLWLQVVNQRPEPNRSEVLLTGITVQLAVSGIGALITAASEKLIAPSQYSIATLVSFEPTFALQTGSSTPVFLSRKFCLNFGPSPVALFDSAGKSLSMMELRDDGAYSASPVVIVIGLEDSHDHTAMAGRVLHWKYESFLDSRWGPF